MATSVSHHCVVLSLLGYRDHDLWSSPGLSVAHKPAEGIGRRIIVGSNRHRFSGRREPRATLTSQYRPIGRPAMYSFTRKTSFYPPFQFVPSNQLSTRATKLFAAIPLLRPAFQSSRPPDPNRLLLAEASPIRRFRFVERRLSLLPRSSARPSPIQGSSSAAAAASRRGRSAAAR
jgi:hypothetical protein